MPRYIVKGSPIRKGGEIIPIGGAVELTVAETKGLEDFLEKAPADKGSASGAEKEKGGKG